MSQNASCTKRSGWKNMHSIVVPGFEIILTIIVLEQRSKKICNKISYTKLLGFCFDYMLQIARGPQKSTMVKRA